MSPPAIASFIFAPVVAPVISQGHFVAFVGPGQWRSLQRSTGPRLPGFPPSVTSTAKRLSRRRRSMDST